MELSEVYKDDGPHSNILSAEGNRWAVGVEEEQVAGRKGMMWSESEG